MRIPEILHHSAVAAILTTVDQIVRPLVIEPARRALDAMRRLLTSHHAAIGPTAQHFGLALVLSLLLLALLVPLGLRLRRAARHRNEHNPASYL